MESIILAAGRGTRMASDLPKVLHPVAGKPMLGHVLDAVCPLGPVHIVVGHQAERVMDYALGYNCPNMHFAVQQQQLGTGHAVRAALPNLSNQGKVLVVLGDVPLIRTSTLESLAAACDQHQAALALLTIDLPNPAGYGRIERNAAGQVMAIVEHKECNAQQLAIKEINTGIMCFNQSALQSWLPRLQANNAKGEYYLTDVVAMAVAEGARVVAVKAQCQYEVMGVNDQMQLALLEREYHRRPATSHLVSGRPAQAAAR